MLSKNPGKAAKLMKKPAFLCRFPRKFGMLFLKMTKGGFSEFPALRFDPYTIKLNIHPSFKCAILVEGAIILAPKAEAPTQ